MSELIIRRIEQNTAKLLAPLWAAAFPEDPSDYIEGFLSNLPPESVTLIGERDGTIATMLFLLRANARFRGKIYPVRYLYAGCTHPQYRGQGYYRELMTAAAHTVREMGEHAIYLHPADDTLTATYKRLGYRAGICGGSQASGAKQAQAINSLNDYMSERKEIVERIADNAVFWSTDDSVTRLFVTDALSRGADMTVDDDTLWLSLSEKTVEFISINDDCTDNNFCLWLPIGDTPLTALMDERKGFTGLIGD